jgi:hypothetical protein
MKTEKTSATLETVLSQYRVFRMSVWAVLALLIAALVCLFINRYAAFALLGLALVFHIFYVRRQQKAYTELVNRSNIELTVMKKIGAEDVSGKSTGGLNASTIKRAGMMPCDGSPSFFWGMEGDMGPFHLQISDVSIPQQFELKKGGKNRMHFDVGVWTHVVLPADSGYRYCIIDETAVPTPIRMAYFDRDPVMFHAELGEPSLKGKAVLYRPMNEEDQRPSPAVMKSLMDLIAYTPGYTALSLHGNEMDLFIRGRFLAMPVTVSKKPTAASLEFDPFPELDYIKKIASACSSTRRLRSAEEAAAVQEN